MRQRSTPTRPTPPAEARDTEARTLPARRNAWWALAAIALLALAVRLIYLRQIQPSPFFTLLMGDSKSYDAWATRLAAGDWIGREVFYQAPLYPYFIGLVYTLFGRDLLILRVVQASLGALSCALLADAGWRLFSKRAGVIAGLGLALYAPAIFFDGLLQKTALDAFLTSLALWIVSRLVTAPARWPTWLGLGAAMGALTLTRENALLLVLILGAWSIAPWFGPIASDAPLSQKLTQRLLPFICGLALLLVPVATRNAVVSGGFYLTTSQFGPNLYLGNNPRTDGTAGSLIAGRGAAEYERQDAVDIAERAEGRTLTPAEVSSYWTSRTLAYVRAQPGDWLRLIARKSALLWNRAEAFDTESQESYAEWSPVLRVASSFGHFGLLVPLAVLGALVSWRDRRRLAIIYVLIGSYAFSVIIFFIYARYRFPLVPMLMLFAGVALSDGIAYARRTPRERLAALVAVVLGVAAFTQWPLLDRVAMRAVTEHNIGAALQSDGRMDEAIAHYRQAIAIKRDYAPAHSNLGAALQARGDSEGAVSAYTSALAIDPTFADAHFNLANTLMDRGDAAAAIEHYRRALETSPDAADVHTNLGVALVAAERVDEGVTELERAVTLAPGAVASVRALGEALAQQGRRDQALVRLQQAVSMAPDDGATHYALGRLLVEIGRTDDAIRELRAAVAQQPLAVDAYNDLAIALASAGQFDEAERLLTQALQQRPSFTEARRNLAMVRAERARQPGR